MTTLNPYLSFDGNCEEAFNFYKSAFGGEFLYLGRFKDAPDEAGVPEKDLEKIMHVSLPVGKNTILMGSDSTGCSDASYVQGTNVTVSINTDSEDEARKLYEGLSAGGQVMMPLGQTFWSPLFAMFIDKFGIQWMVNVGSGE